MAEQPPAAHATASKLAQLLGEVIVHHAPHTARISTEETVRAVNEWLEGLEAHTATFTAPFAKLILDGTDPPEPVRAILAEAAGPTAQFGSTLQQIFLWGIISSIISSSVQPFLQGVTNDLNALAVSQGIKRPVDPSVLATAAARGFSLQSQPTVTVPQTSYDEAAKSGIGSDELDLLASIVGLPPALQELFELYRRGRISIDEVKQGLREGDFRDDWIDRTIALAHAWLTPLDFVRAAVQEQMPYSDARDWATKTGLETTTPLPISASQVGGTDDMFGLAWSIAGRPPGPQELARMALRGIIPWSGRGAGATTFEQGIAESDTKTKWTDALAKLSSYVPPPRQVGTLLEHGAITAEQAKRYWIEGGVPADLADGYVYMAQQQHIGQDKLLAKSEITTLYFDGVFARQEAIDLLGLLGYRDGVADEILQVVDFRREIQAISAVIRRVSSLYGEYKINAAHAMSALEAVGVSAEQAQVLLRTWDQVRELPIRLPTASQIGAAVRYGTLTQAEALDELAKLGYQERDAAIVLSAETHAQITPLPPAGTTLTG